MNQWNDDWVNQWLISIAIVLLLSLSSYVIMCHHMSSYVIICHHMSSYVIICHHMSSLLLLLRSCYSCYFSKMLASSFSIQPSETKPLSRRQDHLGMSDDVGVSMWTGPKCWSRGECGDHWSEQKSDRTKRDKRGKGLERSQKTHDRMHWDTWYETYETIQFWEGKA